MKIIIKITFGIYFIYSPKFRPPLGVLNVPTRNVRYLFVDDKVRPKYPINIGLTILATQKNSISGHQILLNAK